MFDRLRIWFKSRFSAKSAPRHAAMQKTGSFKAPTQRPARRPANSNVPRPKPEFVEVDASLSGEIENNGPGKNVLIRNKYVREDTGTHETLTILDDSLLEDDDSDGIDPYNTGEFDRSRNWDKRFRN
jgi:hypothetical protein